MKKKRGTVRGINLAQLRIQFSAASNFCCAMLLLMSSKSCTDFSKNRIAAPSSRMLLESGQDAPRWEPLDWPTVLDRIRATSGKRCGYLSRKNVWWRIAYSGSNDMMLLFCTAAVKNTIITPAHTRERERERERESYFLLHIKQTTNQYMRRHRYEVQRKQIVGRCEGATTGHLSETP